jgi:hypothetical protein
MEKAGGRVEVGSLTSINMMVIMSSIKSMAMGFSFGPLETLIKESTMKMKDMELGRCAGLMALSM